MKNKLQFVDLEENSEKIGLFAGYRPNRLSLYLLMIRTDRIEELYDVIYKDMKKYKEEEPFYLVDLNEEELSDEDLNGSSFQRSIPAIPSLIISSFGSGNMSDEYKVSKEYHFRNNKTGRIVVLYDWKKTKMYDSEYPEPSKFWSSKDEKRFNLGALNERDTFGFKGWITSQLK